MLHLRPSLQHDGNTLYWIIQFKDALSLSFLIEKGRVQQVTALHAVLRTQTDLY